MPKKLRHNSWRLPKVFITLNKNSTHTFSLNYTNQLKFQTMEKLNKPAILVVDMLNDFVYGALACDRGKAIVPATAQLLEAARKRGVPVIFCNDAHLKGIDRELKLWGDHAIAGTEGAKVIPELNLSECDYVVPKRRYSGFFQTDLDITLKELGVETVVMTGFILICMFATPRQMPTRWATTLLLRRRLPTHSPRRTTLVAWHTSSSATAPTPTQTRSLSRCYRITSD